MALVGEGTEHVADLLESDGDAEDEPGPPLEPEPTAERDSGLAPAEASELAVVPTGRDSERGRIGRSVRKLGRARGAAH